MIFGRVIGLTTFTKTINTANLVFDYEGGGPLIQVTTFSLLVELHLRCGGGEGVFTS